GAQDGDEFLMAMRVRMREGRPLKPALSPGASNRSASPFLHQSKTRDNEAVIASLEIKQGDKPMALRENIGQDRALPQQLVMTPQLEHALSVLQLSLPELEAVMLKQIEQ